MEKWQLLKTKNKGEYYGEVKRGSDITYGCYLFPNNTYYLGQFDKFNMSGFCMRTDNASHFIGEVNNGGSLKSGVELYQDLIIIRTDKVKNGLHRVIVLRTDKGIVSFYETDDNQRIQNRSVTYNPHNGAITVTTHFEDGQTSSETVPFTYMQKIAPIFYFSRLGEMDPWDCFEYRETINANNNNEEGQVMDSSDNTKQERGFIFYDWGSSLQFGQAVKNDSDGWTLCQFKNYYEVSFMKNTKEGIKYFGATITFFNNGDVKFMFRDDTRNVFSDTINYYSESDCFLLCPKTASNGKLHGKGLRIFNLSRIQVTNFKNGERGTNEDTFEASTLEPPKPIVKEETPVEENPIDETPVEEETLEVVEDTPVEETPKEEEVPAKEESPKEDVPAKEEQPVEETPIDEQPQDDNKEVEHVQEEQPPKDDDPQDEETPIEENKDNQQ